MPFFNYLNRLFAYIRNPVINNNPEGDEQYSHSLLDIFNALGLGAALIGALLLYDPGLGHLKIVKAFNPFYIAGMYLYYGVVYSIVAALGLSLLAKTPLSNHELKFNRSFYLFLHTIYDFMLL